MGRLLRIVIGAVTGNVIFRILTALGLSIAGYTFIIGYVQDAFMYMEQMYDGLPSNLIAIFSIAGVPEAMSIIGSALLTAGSIYSARVVFTRS